MYTGAVPDYSVYDLVLTWDAVSQRSELYVNGSLASNLTSYIPSSTLPLRLSARGLSSAYPAYFVLRVDRVFVRPYAHPEPTVQYPLHAVARPVQPPPPRRPLLLPRRRD
jgi:hypothetical protein